MTKTPTAPDGWIVLGDVIDDDGHVVGPFAIPPDAVTETFALMAMRRVGKSNAAVVIAEGMYDIGAPFVAVDPKGDWWGIRAEGPGGPGLPIPVFGGRHGDLPLEPTGGALVARLIVEKRLTAVLDVSMMLKAQRRRFLTDYFQTLYDLNEEPLHVFLEECDDYIPQRVPKDMTTLVGAVEELVKNGGFKGLGMTLLSQRSASVNNDVLTQVGTLIPMRTTAPADRKPIGDWMRYHAVAAGLLDGLPSLGNGEALVWSPHWLPTFGLPAIVRVRFRRRRTFDSGATPRLAKGVSRPTATLADIDIAAVAAEMADTIERAKADDPTELKQKLAKAVKDRDSAVRRAEEAESALANEKANPTTSAPPEQVEVPVLGADDRSRLIAVTAALNDMATNLQSVGASLPVLREEWTDIIESVLARLDATPERVMAARVAPQVPAPHRAVASAREARPAPKPSAAPAGSYRAGAVRMLDSLAKVYPGGLTRAQLGTLAKVKSRGGTFGTYYAELKRDGAITEEGTVTRITDVGFAAIGRTAPAPQTPQEKIDMWRSTMRAGERAMFEHLLTAYPNGLTRADLGELDGVPEPSGGTFGTYLSLLRNKGCVEERDRRLYASENLFIMGAA